MLRGWIWVTDHETGALMGIQVSQIQYIRGPGPVMDGVYGAWIGLNVPGGGIAVRENLDLINQKLEIEQEFSMSDEAAAPHHRK